MKSWKQAAFISRKASGQTFLLLLLKAAVVDPHCKDASLGSGLGVWLIRREAEPYPRPGVP